MPLDDGRSRVNCCAPRAARRHPPPGCPPTAGAVHARVPPERGGVCMGPAGMFALEGEGSDGAVGLSRQEKSGGGTSVLGMRRVTQVIAAADSAAAPATTVPATGRRAGDPERAACSPCLGIPLLLRREALFTSAVQYTIPKPRRSVKRRRARDPHADGPGSAAPRARHRAAARPTPSRRTPSSWWRRSCKAPSRSRANSPRGRWRRYPLPATPHMRRPAMSARRPAEETARLGKDIYERDIRPRLRGRITEHTLPSTWTAAATSLPTPV